MLRGDRASSWFVSRCSQMPNSSSVRMQEWIETQFHSVSVGYNFFLSISSTSVLCSWLPLCCQRLLDHTSQTFIISGPLLRFLHQRFSLVQFLCVCLFLLCLLFFVFFRGGFGEKGIEKRRKGEKKQTKKLHQPRIPASFPVSLAWPFEQLLVVPLEHARLLAFAFVVQQFAQLAQPVFK